MTLGEYLRSEREKRGITIEQVASATKIGIRLLHSLEADQFGELPAKPFIRGFVTSYARFIGLSPSEILTRFGDFIDKKAEERPVRDAGHSGYAFEKKEGESARTTLWIILGVFAVLGAVAVVLFRGPRHHHGSHADKLREAHGGITEESPSGAPSATPSTEASAAPSPEASAAAVVPSATPSPSPSPSPAPSPSPSVTPSPSPSPVPSPSPSPAASPSPAPSPTGKPDELNSGVNLKPSQIKHKLIFRAVGDVRVRYQIDERSMMSFILRKGRILVLRAERTVKFQVTRPGDVTLNYNNGGEKPLDKFKNLVTRHNDATLIFPAEDIEKTQDPFPGTPSLTGR